VDELKKRNHVMRRGTVVQHQLELHVSLFLSCWIANFHVLFSRSPASWLVLFSIMITSSYLLSKYTNDLTKRQHVLNAVTPTSTIKTPSLKGQCVIQMATHRHSIITRLPRDSTCEPKVPLSTIYGLLTTATEPDRVQ
jgi:hypothetical protein